MLRNQVSGLSIASVLHNFIVNEALPGTGVTPEAFFTGLARLIADLAPKNHELLDMRNALQLKIDSWHKARVAVAHDPIAYQDMLKDIGYLRTAPLPFNVRTQNVDDEIARLGGPQLVVPLSNPRYALNAANARWAAFTMPSTELMQ